MPTLRYSSEQRQQQHVADWQLSGLSRTQYARLHHLSTKTFCRWVTKWLPSSSSPPPFIPAVVTRKPDKHNADNVILNLKRCSVTCQPDQLLAIMTALDLC